MTSDKITDELEVISNHYWLVKKKEEYLFAIFARWLRYNRNYVTLIRYRPVLYFDKWVITRIPRSIALEEYNYVDNRAYPSDTPEYALKAILVNWNARKNG